MAKKKLGMGTIEINKKFGGREDAFDYAKRLREHIRYVCEKNAVKGWYAQAMIVISNLKKEVSQLRYINSGKRGRPRKELYINERTANEWYKGNYRTDWHIHILLVSKPGCAFRNEIKEYIDKNWIGIPNTYEKKPFDINKLGSKKVYKKYCNINMADYFIDQSNDILFCDYNFTNEESLKYSLKEYYREYLKTESGKRRLYVKARLNPMKEDRYLKELEKVEGKLKIIEKYYFNITVEQNKKEAETFMKKMQLSKISENYNKVQKNINRMPDESVPF